MFKFDIIESQKQTRGIPLTDLIRRKIKFIQGKNIILEDLSKATFIHTEGRGIAGGACLVKKEIKHIHQDVRTLVANLALHQGHVWECSGVYLETSLTYPTPDSPEFRFYSQAFYRELYEELVEFGKKNHIGFMIMKLGSEVYASTKEFGLWPYVVELKPKNASQGIFHGILPLTGSQYEAYQNVWKDLDKTYFYERKCGE